MILHGWRSGMMNIAVTRQHPLEFVIQKLRHRARLLGPRIPRHTPKGRQRLSRRRPCQVIAREEKLVAVKIDHVTACMTRHGNHEQIIVQLYWFLTTDDLFDAKTSGAIVGVHYSFAVESLTKQFVICNVVFVRE